jgi:thymidine phosphorylase
MHHYESNRLKAKSVGIDTYRENIIFIRADCHICRSEGFTALTRVIVRSGNKEIVATLNVVYSLLISLDEAGLSMEAMKRLGVIDGDIISVTHLKPLASLSKVRSKMYGRELLENDFEEIIEDVVSGRYSNIELAAFVTVCAGNNLSVQEMIRLTKAMTRSGDRIKWNNKIILDKHSVGGLPGNRTTPVVVSIIAAAGETIPKTSSRAITSPAGTADTVSTMTRVELSVDEIKDIVGKEGGCMAWGGAVGLSPADDILIAIEKSLDIDSTGQMVSSVLSKKAAAGSTHVLIDIPVGETAKVRSHEEALKMQYFLKAAAEQIGLVVEVVITDGSQPVGKGIGPALEAMDILAVLRNDPKGPADLKQKSIMLAGKLLELSGKYSAENGKREAERILNSGEALNKFMKICAAQGGFKEPEFAEFKYDVIAVNEGVVRSVDNRKLARIAKLAGAPRSPSAGIVFNAPLGKKIQKGDLIFTIYAETTGELEYAKEYLSEINGIIKIE